MAENGVRQWQVTDAEAGQRLDNFLLRVMKGVPRSHIYKILRSGEVRVNKGRARPHYHLAEGDVLRLPPVRWRRPAIPPYCQPTCRASWKPLSFTKTPICWCWTSPAGWPCMGDRA